MIGNMKAIRILVRALTVAVLAWLTAGVPGVLAGDGVRLSAADKAIYAQAFRLAETRRFDKARKLALTASDPRLSKVILWRGFSTERQEAGDFAAIAAFLAHNPEWPGRGAMRLRAEKAMADGLDDAAVLSWFETQAALTLEGAARHGEALLRAGLEEQAIAAIRAAWVERDSATGREAPFLKRFGDFIRQEDHTARLERLLWARSDRAARRQARRLGKGYAALAEARLRLARNRPGVDSAIESVPAALRGDPGLRFERARWRQSRRRANDTLALLDPPLPGAPQAERWWRLRHWGVRKALALGEISAAYRIASGHGLTAGLGFAQGEWLAGWIALRFLDMPREAFAHFTRLHGGVSSSVSLGRGAFWAGEAARGLAKRAKSDEVFWRQRARQWYIVAAIHDTSYYGQLASRRLGLDPGIVMRAHAVPDEGDRQAFQDRELVQVVALLAELGERKLMERFMARLRSLAMTGKDYVLIAELAVSVARPDLALRAARAARGQGIVLPDVLFPPKPPPNPAAPKTGQPEAALVLALIRQESGFYPQAVSGSGARGLMQIMPATARQVARKVALRYSKTRLLDDPDYNLLLGTTYLSGLLERYGGSYALALAAYNAGPARANRWIDTYGDPRETDVDAIDWIESIPIDETRNYVQRILESLTAYRQHLGIAQAGRAGLPKLSAFVSFGQ